MTDKKYKLIEGKLVEQPSMKEPPYYIFTPNYSAEDYYKDLDKYNEQKANCAEYTVVGSIHYS